MKEKFVKYSMLLLDRCLSLKAGVPLLISAPIESIEFIRVLSLCALKRGITDIYYDWYDDILKHQQLVYFDCNNIEESLFWNKKVYDDYANKGAAFLMFVSEDPDLMNDIDTDKLAFASKISRTSRPIYKKKQGINEVSWCIASVSTLGWANKVYPNDDGAVNKLWNTIFDICLVNDDNPIESWNNKVFLSNKRCSLLNNLNIKMLHYTNSLGTDLFVGLSFGTKWYGAGEVNLSGDNIICNMPTEEVFTTPNRLMTNGVVYSSKPLVYNGSIISDFMLEFKDGKVVGFSALHGEDVLKSIIYGDNNSCYLGECALVDYNSPISNSGILFYTTLFDENASCHLALGAGFPNSLDGTLSKNDLELNEMGINTSSVHVDFMIGTSDMKIEAITYDGDSVLIFDNGNFVLDFK